MTRGDSRPGPPPLPPDGFPAREMPTVEIAAGTTLFRIHRASRDVFHYGPRPHPEDRGRWDAPDLGYGLCYVAEHEHTAFAETLLRDLDREDLSEQDEIAPLNLARLEVVTPIVLVRMHGPGLRRLKATATVVQGPYEGTWAWSQAVHRHPLAVAGIRYRARHDDDDHSIALFDRARDAVRVLDSKPLLHSARIPVLRECLDRYTVRLAP